MHPRMPTRMQTRMHTRMQLVAGWIILPVADDIRQLIGWITAGRRARASINSAREKYQSELSDF
jgi:hypothetical protein